MRTSSKLLLGLSASLLLVGCSTEPSPDTQVPLPAETLSAPEAETPSPPPAETSPTPTLNNPSLFPSEEARVAFCTAVENAINNRANTWREMPDPKAGPSAFDEALAAVVPTALPQEQEYWQFYADISRYSETPDPRLMNSSMVTEATIRISTTLEGECGLSIP